MGRLHREESVAMAVLVEKGETKVEVARRFGVSEGTVRYHIKRNGVSKKPLMKGEPLRARVDQGLAAIKTNPGLVRPFFDASSVAYI